LPFTYPASTLFRNLLRGEFQGGFRLHQAQIIELLLELQQKENMALVLITHDLALVAEAKPCCGSRRRHG
jgi:predicted ABC-type transport system involved in lysophospholipase L1 biosynthesis ATPase subunit